MFNSEELIALKNMVDFSSTYISLDDEPLLNDLSEKLRFEIQKIEDRKPM